MMSLYSTTVLNICTNYKTVNPKRGENLAKSFSNFCNFFRIFLSFGKSSKMGSSHCGEFTQIQPEKLASAYGKFQELSNGVRHVPIGFDVAYNEALSHYFLHGGSKYIGLPSSLNIPRLILARSIFWGLTRWGVGDDGARGNERTTR